MSLPPRLPRPPSALDENPGKAATQATGHGAAPAFGARAGIAARVLAAGLGGYVVASVGAAALAAVLPMPRGDAVMAAVLLSFAIYVAAIVWAFAARSALRALCGIAAAAGLSLLVLAVAGSGLR